MLSIKSPRDKTSTISKHVSKCTEVLLFIGVTDPFDIARLYLRTIFVNHVCISDAVLRHLPTGVKIYSQQKKYV